MAFVDSDWGGDRKTRRSTTVLEELGNHCIESVQSSQRLCKVIAQQHSGFRRDPVQAN